jgi:(2R)-3-sulfolactate dehydrogenase (NADP+)
VSFAGLVEAARRYGVGVFAQHGSFTCGQLGWFTERLATAGLVAVATAVSPALLAAGPGTGRVFGTNPMAYSVPRGGRAPFTVDQASSSTAFVSVRDAAAQGTPSPRDGP